MSQQFTLQMPSLIGTLTLVCDGKALTAVHLDGASAKQDNHPLLQAAKRQCEEYFAGERREFDLPLEPQGTEFQRAVWRALLDVPYGATASYAEIARAIGKPKACRAVGAANGRNPLAIVVPCHRVIGADGSLTGYGGGLKAKQWLLNHERAVVGGMLVAR